MMCSNGIRVWILYCDRIPKTVSLESLMALLESAFSDLAGAQRAYGLVGALSNLILCDLFS